MVYPRDSFLLLPLLTLIVDVRTKAWNSDQSLNKAEIDQAPVDKNHGSPGSSTMYKELDDGTKPIFACKIDWYPFFALIDRESSKPGVTVLHEKCVGTFIAPTMVLTSAYCCSNKDILGVYAGYQEDSNTWMQYTPTAGKQLHPNFRNGSFAFDACVIKLNSELLIGAEAEVMDVTPKDFEPGSAIMLGYGTNRSGSIYHLSDQETMLCIRATILSADDCTKRMEAGGVEVIGYDSTVMMCAETAERRTGYAIDFDSGGPVIADRHQIGIASLAVKPPKGGNTLSFFTRIEAVYDFLDAGIRSSGSVRMACMIQQLLLFLPMVAILRAITSVIV